MKKQKYRIDLQLLRIESAIKKVELVIKNIPKKKKIHLQDGISGKLYHLQKI